ncbi:MAG: hypothetical protein AAGH15_12245 [Myxococcota bacterium]
MRLRLRFQLAYKGQPLVPVDVSLGLPAAQRLCALALRGIANVVEPPRGRDSDATSAQ